MKRYFTLNNIYKRLKGQSPTFFKKLRNLSVAIAGFGAALATAKGQFPDFMEFIPNQVVGYIITAGVVCAFVASLTVTNPEENNVK